MPQSQKPFIIDLSNMQTIDADLERLEKELLNSADADGRVDLKAAAQRAGLSNLKN